METSGRRIKEARACSEQGSKKDSDSLSSIKNLKKKKKKKRPRRGWVDFFKAGDRILTERGDGITQPSTEV